MLKFEFRSLFVFFLLTGIFIGQVLPFDSSMGLFEREEVQENTLSETKADKPDGAPLHIVFAFAPDSCSIMQNRNGKPITAVRITSLCARNHLGHTPRGPPLSAPKI